MLPNLTIKNEHFKIRVSDLNKIILFMKRSKFTESQILFALKLNEIGVNTEDICRKLGISEATFII